MSSSLPDVLEADVPLRFYLSPKAAAGILRRAAKRGRELPPALAEVLRALASQYRDEGKRTMRTSSPGPLAQDERAEAEPLTLMGMEPMSLPSTSSKADQTTTAPERDILSGSLEQGLAAPDSTSMGPTSEGTVRRLTPTECERLQGLPDTWTVPTGPTLVLTDPGMQRAVTL